MAPERPPEAEHVRNAPTRSEHVANARPVASRLGPVGATVPDDVLALVRAVPAWSGVELDVAELHGGITNRNYRVDVDGRSYVIRIPGEATELLGIDRGGELAAAARAADLGIGPPVFGELPGLGTVITGFVPGSPVDGESILAGDRVERVVDAVAALHRSSPLEHAFPIFRIIERHASDAVGHGAALPTDYDVLAAAMARIEQVFVGDGRSAGALSQRPAPVERAVRR